MKVAALFSGGKDSSLAVWKALEQGHKIARLLAFKPINRESYMFHYPNIDLTRLQAKASGLPITIIESDGEKEEELIDIEKAISSVKEEIDGICVGALASVYQAERVERICRKLSLKMYAPLWNYDPKKLWKDLLGEGFAVMVVGVACEGLTRSWLGRIIDKNVLKELEKLSEKYRFHLGGEGGEFESLVLDAPFFQKKLIIKEANTAWDGVSGRYDISKAALKDKP